MPREHQSPFYPNDPKEAVLEALLQQQAGLSYGMPVYSMGSRTGPQDQWANLQATPTAHYQGQDIIKGLTPFADLSGQVSMGTGAPTTIDPTLIGGLTYRW